MTSAPFGAVVSCCISPPFGRLSTTRGKITYVLLTRAPLYRGRSPFSCDLHVLGAPLTFVLSQDQTLQLNPVGQLDRGCPRSAANFFSLSKVVRWVTDRLFGDPRSLSRVYIALSFQGPRGNTRVPAGAWKLGRSPPCVNVRFPRFGGHRGLASIYAYLVPFFGSRSECWNSGRPAGR